MIGRIFFFVLLLSLIGRCLPEEHCADGVDNDYDEFVDCADPDCWDEVVCL